MEQFPHCKNVFSISALSQLHVIKPVRSPACSLSRRRELYTVVTILSFHLQPVQILRLGNIELYFNTAVPRQADGVDEVGGDEFLFVGVGIGKQLCQRQKVAVLVQQLLCRF